MRGTLFLLVAALGACAIDVDDVGSMGAALAPTPEERVPALGVQTGNPLGMDGLAPFALNDVALARVNFGMHLGGSTAMDGTPFWDQFDPIVASHAQAGVALLPCLLKGDQWPVGDGFEGG